MNGDQHWDKPQSGQADGYRHAQAGDCCKIEQLSREPGLFCAQIEQHKKQNDREHGYRSAAFQRREDKQQRAPDRGEGALIQQMQAEIDGRGAQGGEHEDDQIISAQRGNHPARSDAMDCVAANQILKQGRSEGNADHCRPANSAEGKTLSAEWEARPAVFAEPVQRFGAVLHGTLADDPEPEPEQKEEQAPGQDRPVGKVFLKELHGSITSRGIVYQITEERATDFFFFSKKHCIQSTFPIK